MAFLSLPKDQHSLLATIANAAKTTRRKRRLQRLGKTMVDCQKTMETSVLLRIKLKTEALHIQQRQGFAEPDNGLRAFID